MILEWKSIMLESTCLMHLQIALSLRTPSPGKRCARSTVSFQLPSMPLLRSLLICSPYSLSSPSSSIRRNRATHGLFAFCLLFVVLGKERHDLQWLYLILILAPLIIRRFSVAIARIHVDWLLSCDSSCFESFYIVTVLSSSFNVSSALY
jgi:hypothetical protein